VRHAANADEFLEVFGHKLRAVVRDDPFTGGDTPRRAAWPWATEALRSRAPTWTCPSALKDSCVRRSIRIGQRVRRNFSCPRHEGPAPRGCTTAVRRLHCIEAICRESRIRRDRDRLRAPTGPGPDGRLPLVPLSASCAQCASPYFVSCPPNSEPSK